MTISLYAGLTSQTIDVLIGDSSSELGNGLSGLVYNSSGLTCYYRKGATGSNTSITLATQTVGGAFSSGGFVEIDATNAPGLYRFDVPNAVIDTEGFVTMFFRGAANMIPCAVRIDCRPQPADVKKLLGTAWLTPATAGTPDVNAKQFGGAPVTATTSVTIPAASTLLTTAGTLATVTTATNVTTVNGLAANVITDASLAASAVTEIHSGLAASTDLATAQAGITDIQSRIPGALVGGRMESSVGAIAASTTAATIAGAFWDSQETGTAQAGASTTITLASGESAVNDYYKDQAILLTGGTGAKQVRRISAYVGSTKVATVSAAWATTPDNTTTYAIIGRIE